MQILEAGEYLIHRAHEVYLIRPCKGCKRDVCQGQLIASVNSWASPLNPKAEYEFRYFIVRKVDAKTHPNIDYRKYCHYKEA